MNSKRWKNPQVLSWNTVTYGRQWQAFTVLGTYEIHYDEPVYYLVTGGIVVETGDTINDCVRAALHHLNDRIHGYE